MVFLYKLLLMQECRYCLISEDKLNDLIDPCNCGGSMRYVHEKCLKDWILNSQKPSTYKYEDNMRIYLLKCEICHFDMKFIKEYENGIIYSLIKSVFGIISDGKTLSIFFLHSMILYFFFKRLKLVLKYLYSLYQLKLKPNNLMKFFHEFAIFLSIYLGVQDIFKYYSELYSDKRKMTMRFLNKNTNETFSKSTLTNSNKANWMIRFLQINMTIDSVHPHSDSN